MHSVGLLGAIDTHPISCVSFFCFLLALKRSSEADERQEFLAARLSEKWKHLKFRDQSRETDFPHIAPLGSLCHHHPREAKY
jgi:hypothetical protein